MRIRLFLLFFLLSNFSQAQVKTKKIDKTKVPTTIQYTGSLKEAVTWIDNTGTHYVVTAEIGPVASKLEPDSQDAALYAYHYLLVADTLQLIWKVSDFIKSCPVDIKASFVKNTFTVTDLNNDKQSEVWLMYQTACRGDVSPSSMKIVMYEGSQKYAARGTTKVQVAEKEYEGGSYTFDAAFNNAPEVFKSYAKGLWKKNILETWE
jgi:hypothetical protein